MAAWLPIVLIPFFISSCAAQQIQTDFYKGLQASALNVSGDRDAHEKNQNEALAFFEKALSDPNAFVRTAAAAKLLHQFHEGREFPAPLMNRIKNSAPPSWAEAFDILDSGPAVIKGKALAFLLGSGQPDTPFFPAIFPDEAALYTLRECIARNPEMFSPAETAAINGNIAVSRSRYQEALGHFRLAFEEAPGSALYFHNPPLINRLGRAFQYSGAGNQGIALFRDWEINLPGTGGLSTESIGDIRFRLLFFMGRMARQQECHDEGISYFQQALPFAPDASQADACIWYILDTALRNNQSNFSQLLAELMPFWHDKAYYNDVLDKFASGLVLNRRWADIAALYPLVRDYADGESIAQYAYIIGRALEEGLLSMEQATDDRAALVRSYLETAYQQGNKALYYHLMSAEALQKPFIAMPQQTRPPQQKQPETPAMEFLQGFFSHNAADHAPGYIRSLDRELTPEQKRHLAKSLHDAGLYADSMRLLNSCLPWTLEHGGIEWDRQDWEVYYPRPFRDYVEKYAHETNAAPELLYSLIRTESAFQSSVVSRAGAVGLTQLLPATAEEMADRIRRRGGPDYTGEAALRNPEKNIHIGAVYLNYLMDRMGSPLMALLAYNGGMNRVRRWRNANPRLSEDLFMESIEFRETREYGKKVLAAQAMYKALYHKE